jgi:predicted HicB family RNase H-like nuclease
MKRIVNGVTYNTDTSTMLARREWSDDGQYTGVPQEGTDTLYQTRGGAFFLHEWEERQRRNEDEEWVTRQYNNFTPLSAEKAQKWLLSGDIEVLHNPFDDPPEAAAEEEPAATLYLRIPPSLKRRIDAAAEGEKLSANVWAMRCIERCLAPTPVTRLSVGTEGERADR